MEENYSTRVFCHDFLTAQNLGQGAVAPTTFFPFTGTLLQADISETGQSQSQQFKPKCV